MGVVGVGKCNSKCPGMSVMSEAIKDDMGRKLVDKLLDIRDLRVESEFQYVDEEGCTMINTHTRAVRACETGQACPVTHEMLQTASLLIAKALADN